MKISFKDSPIGTTLLFVGLAFIFVGTAINAYNQMFGNKTSSESTEEVSEDSTASVPTDMNAVSEQLNKDLAVYLAGAVGATEHDTDVLSIPAKRLALVNVVLENQGKSAVSNNITYVTSDVYAAAYEEVFGSTDQLESDLSTAYTDKANVDAVLGEGNVGWTSMTAVGLERTLTAASVTADEENGVNVIEGTYTDTQLGAAAGSGTFTITYGNNGSADYIVSITLTAAAK
ncbi:MAG: hypothetical protein IJ193_04970 [Bacilli bacterium]|nr:hypothetical protein [Bacilli bacterium]